MDTDFSAGTCPQAELVEITTLQDLTNHKRIYICSNPICEVENGKCNTIYEEKFTGVQYPLKAI